MHGEVTSPFKGKYQRNNKRTGQKNIRCFPDCSERGHQSSGFCGRYLTAHVSGVRRLGPHETIRCWGVFTQCGSDELLVVGSKMDLAEATANERSRSSPLKPWLRGEVTDCKKEEGGSDQTQATAGDLAIEVVFNRQLLGWHYDWTSTKHTCDAFHVFKMMVFILDDTDRKLTFVGSIRSPEFQLYSRRRQQQMYEQQLAEKAAQAAAKVNSGKASAITGMLLLDQGLEDASQKRSRDGTGEDGEEEFFTRRKRLLTDSTQIQKRRERNLILDRLMRFILGIGAPQPSFQTSSASVGAPRYDMAQNARSTDIYFTKREPDTTNQVGNGSAEVEDEDETGSASLLLPFLMEENEVRPTLPPDTDFDMLIERTLGQGREEDCSTSTRSDECREAFFDEDAKDLIGPLERLLIEKGSASIKSKLDHIISVLRKLPDAVVSISTNRKDVERFMKKWSSPAGVRALKLQFEEEKKTTGRIEGFIDADEEDESGRFQSSDASTFESVYASMRNLFRNIMVEALGSCGADLDEFKQPMELAARYRLLNADPFFPPSKRTAALTHFQLYGNLDKFQRQDFGCRRGKFSSDEERREWISAYWKVRRKTFRNLIIRRIVEERRVPQLPQALPVDPRFDLSGVWYSCSSREYSGIIVKLTKILGNSMGELVARLFEQCWKRINIKMNCGGMIVQGEKVLLANPRDIYIFDCTPHTLKIPSPLPLAAWSQERVYVSWYAVENGCHFVHVVYGGPTRAEHIDKYLESAIAEERDSPDFDEFARRADLIRNSAQTRVAKSYSISDDRETLYISTRFHFFSAEAAPRFQLSDVQALQAMVRPNMPSEVAFFTSKYIRAQEADECGALGDLPGMM